MTTILSLPVPLAPTAAPVPAETAPRGPLAPPTKLRPVAAFPLRRPTVDQPKVGVDERFERLERQAGPRREPKASSFDLGRLAGGGDFEILETRGSIRYLAQLLGQEGEARDGSPVTEHRDGPLLGTEAYRRAGADPLLYSEDPEIFRLAV